MGDLRARLQRDKAWRRFIASMVMCLLYLVGMAATQRIVWATSCSTNEASRQDQAIYLSLYWPLSLPLYLTTMAIPCPTKEAPPHA